MVRLIPLLIIYTFSSHAFGQIESNNKINIGDLIGTWKYATESSKDVLILIKIPNKSNYNGLTLEFLPNGIAKRRLSDRIKKCGNDRRTKITINERWNVNGNRLSLIRGNLKSIDYEILSFSVNKLVIQKEMIKNSLVLRAKK